MGATTAEPRWLRAATRAPMDARTMGRVIAMLRRGAPALDRTAIAALVEASGDDPFRILIA